MDTVDKSKNQCDLMKERDLRFREKVLIKLILKAALKKKKRLKNAFLGESHILEGQNMN